MGAIDRANALAARTESRLTRDEAEGSAWWYNLRNDDRAVWCQLADTTEPAEAWRYFKKVCAGIDATAEVVAPGSMFAGASGRAKHLAWLANWVRMAARAAAPLDAAERFVLLRAVDEALGLIAVSSDVGKRLVSLLTMLAAEVAAHDGIGAGRTV